MLFIARHSNKENAKRPFKSKRARVCAKQPANTTSPANRRYQRTQRCRFDGCGGALQVKRCHSRWALAPSASLMFQAEVWVSCPQPERSHRKARGWTWRKSSDAVIKGARAVRSTAELCSYRDSDCSCGSRLRFTGPVEQSKGWQCCSQEETRSGAKRDRWGILSHELNRVEKECTCWGTFWKSGLTGG